MDDDVTTNLCSLMTIEGSLQVEKWESKLIDNIYKETYCAYILW